MKLDYKQSAMCFPQEKSIFPAFFIFCTFFPLFSQLRELCEYVYLCIDVCDVTKITQSSKVLTGQMTNKKTEIIISDPVIRKFLVEDTIIH